MSILSEAQFHNEEAAYKFVEARVWPNGPVCPHCGCFERVGKMGGKSTRIGTHKCYDCRKPFTVKIGTIFESSHVPLRLWLQAIFLIASSKKGVSANQLHRTLGVTLKTAWFMGNDRTKKPKGAKKGRGYEHKNKVLALVDRSTGRSRSLVVDNLKSMTLIPILQENIAREARIMTDEANQYFYLRQYFSGHGIVKHMHGEYVSRLDSAIHTNTIEGFFSIFKRGMKGVYQHCGHHHLNRYLAEFDFRYSNRVALGVNDKERADKLLSGVVGKRLTYRTTR
jgi:transposase-like protein